MEGLFDFQNAIPTSEFRHGFISSDYSFPSVVRPKEKSLRKGKVQRVSDFATLFGHSIRKSRYPRDPPFGKSTDKGVPFSRRIRRMNRF